MRIKYFLLHYDSCNSCKGVMTQLLSGAAGQSRAKPQQCKQGPGEKLIISQTQWSQASDCSTFFGVFLSICHHGRWMVSVCTFGTVCWLRTPQLPHRRVQEPNGNVPVQIHAPPIPSPDTQERRNAWNWRNHRSQYSLHHPPGTLVFGSEDLQTFQSAQSKMQLDGWCLP